MLIVHFVPVKLLIQDFFFNHFIVAIYNWLTSNYIFSLPQRNSFAQTIVSIYINEKKNTKENMITEV